MRAETPNSPATSSTDPINLRDPAYYLNREISWLRFNQRVLHEAFDERTLLLERLKFMAIYSSNLDEYFMVRVAGLKQQIAAQVTQRSLDGLTPQAQLDAIHQELKPEIQEQHQYFTAFLKPELAKENICLLDYANLNPQQVAFLHQYFLDQIFPVLTPLAVDPGHPFPYISNLSLNLAVLVKDTQTGDGHFARVKVPSMLPRFIKLPADSCSDSICRWSGVPIEQVIAQNLEFLFPGMTIQACYPFRITRNADIELEEDEADDLLLAIEEELRKRRFGFVVRMEIQTGTPEYISRTLMRELGLEESDVYHIDGLLSLNDLMGLAFLPFPHLQQAPWTPIVPSRLRKVEPLEVPVATVNGHAEKSIKEHPTDIFSVIRGGDLLVHHPYDSFTATVQKFITQAAHDPNVLTIKMTLYRTAGDGGLASSPIVSSLIAAAENGKQVVALVELKARFDEENNIVWARKLEKVGVHVVYGLVGLKTHTKIALVVRREGKQIRRYVHIGTGNYNPKTARLYTDLGLLSCRDELGADLTDLFNYLTGFSRHQSYRKLLVAPVNLRDRILELIDREVDHQRQGNAGRIIAKMNSLVDPKIIRALYRASQAGVKIKLIVRGICSLKPGIEGVSTNISVISIIGRFLEHDRIFYFHNQGQPTVLIGSADWRQRNLDRRVEAVVPIEDPALVAELRELLEIMLSDNRQAWDLQPDGTFIQRRPGPDEAERSTHELFMQRTTQYAHCLLH
ncbi:polyphosphate kinase 1 [Acaryochloris sp. IP29b_bin.148]|uniref:polyphosphate kinase 1 n=1 Tax=Acaryochloris sp. IP29b_bin.148 TaxID=2969218 RepID=UPI0026357C43|nr:polyphosphate kinase 1 [Acaryochloris sp. IP29b_bin.148]